MVMKRVPFKASGPAMLRPLFFVRVCPGEADLSQTAPGAFWGWWPGEGSGGGGRCVLAWLVLAGWNAWTSWV